MRLPGQIAPSKTVILILEALFVLSGVVSTLGGQVMIYNGAAGKSGMSMVISLLQYLGMIILFFVPNSLQDVGYSKEKVTKVDVDLDVDVIPVKVPVHHRNNSQSDRSETLVEVEPADDENSTPKLMWIWLALMEWLGGVLCTLGVVFAGSGIFQVVYATVVIFTALLARIVLGHRLNWQQWASIGVVTLGLAISSRGRPKNVKLGEDVTLGVFITLGAAMAYSVAYVTAEGMMKGKQQTNAEMFRGYGFIGSLVTAFIVTYFGMVIFPKVDSEIVEHVIDVEGSWAVIIVTSIVVLLSCSLHTYTYILLLNYVGATAAGVMQGLRAVLVFLISGMAFCSIHEEQCFTLWKGIASLLIVCGIMAFRALGDKTSRKE